MVENSRRHPDRTDGAPEACVRTCAAPNVILKLRLSAAATILLRHLIGHGSLRGGRRPTKQSPPHAQVKGDCFASLAMTRAPSSDAVSLARARAGSRRTAAP